MRPLLAWLRRLGLAGDDPPPAPGPLDELMGRYRHWMVTDRQLAARTIRRYEQGARLFLAWPGPGRAEALLVSRA